MMTTDNEQSFWDWQTAQAFISEDEVKGAQVAWDNRTAHYEAKLADKDAEIAKQVAAIEVLGHMVMEVRHAQEVGAGWYTRGAGGLYQQVRLWLDKADADIKSVEPELLQEDMQDDH